MTTTMIMDEGDWEGRPGLAQAWLALVERWRVTVAERRGLLAAGDDHGDEVPAEMAERMTVLVGIDGQLRATDDRALREWLRTPVLLFALGTPLEVMSGPMADLLRFRTLVQRGFGS